MKATITMTTLLVILVGAVWVGFGLLTAPFDTDTEPEATCEMREFDEGDELAAFQVRVNVLNSSQREGLAYNQLNELGAKGFSLGYFSNARDIDVSAVTIMTDDPEHPTVRLVARQFSDDVAYVELDEAIETDDESVTVLLGQGYSGVNADAGTTFEVTDPFSWCAAIPLEEEELPEL